MTTVEASLRGGRAVAALLPDALPFAEGDVRSGCSLGSSDAMGNILRDEEEGGS